MRMNKLKSYAIIAVLICAVLSQMLCTTDYAGGSEIGNPMVVTGMVTDSSGKGIPDVTIYLVDPLERRPQKLIPDSCYKGYSDTDGKYILTCIYSGRYNLLGIDSSGAEMFLKSIEINRPDDSDNDTVLCRSDTLEAAANVIVPSTDCEVKERAIIFVPGTVIQAYIDTCGEYLIKCPPSTIDIILYRGDSSTILADDITVEAGQWLDLTKKSYHIPSPHFESGLLSGFAGTVYSFSAGGITLGPNHPVQYRFDWGNTVSQWGFPSHSTHAWNEQGTYLVRVQARSVRDTLSVSEWSSAIDVSIQ